MNIIHRFLLKCEKIKCAFFFELLKQSNFITIKLFTHENAELQEDIYKLRQLILQPLE